MLLLTKQKKQQRQRNMALLRLVQQEDFETMGEKEMDRRAKEEKSGYTYVQVGKLSVAVLHNGEHEIELLSSGMGAATLAWSGRIGVLLGRHVGQQGWC